MELDLLPADCWNVVLRHLTQQDRCSLLACSKRLAAALQHTQWPHVCVAADRLAKSRCAATRRAELASLHKVLARHCPSMLTVNSWIGSERVHQLFIAHRPAAPGFPSRGEVRDMMHDGTKPAGGTNPESKLVAAGEEARTAYDAAQPLPRCSACGVLQPLQPCWGASLQALSLTTDAAGLSRLTSVRLPALHSLTARLDHLTCSQVQLPDLSLLSPRLESLHLRWVDQVVAATVNAANLGRLGPSLRSLTISARAADVAHVYCLSPALRRLSGLTELQMLDVSLDWEGRHAAEEAAAGHAEGRWKLVDALPATLEHLALCPPTPTDVPHGGSVLPALARLPCLRHLALHWWLVDESEQQLVVWDDGQIKARLGTALPAVEELHVVVEGGGTLFLGPHDLVSCPNLRRIVIELSERAQEAVAFTAYAHLVVEGGVQGLAGLLRCTDLRFYTPAGELRMLPPAMFETDVREMLDLHCHWEQCQPTALTTTRGVSAPASWSSADVWGFEAGWHRCLVRQPDWSSWTHLRG